MVEALRGISNFAGVFAISTHGFKTLGEICLAILKIRT